MNRYFFFLIFLTTSTMAFGDGNEEQSIVLDIETAVSRALNCNRQLLGSLDNYRKSYDSVILAADEFSLKLSPNAKGGYTGGGRDGTGGTVGGGFSLAKKFTTGSVFKISPLLVKTPDHFRTDVEAIFSQPLMRGFNREYQFSTLRGAEFNWRTTERQLYITQIQLIVKTITALYDIVRAYKTAELYQESYQRTQKLQQVAQWKEKIGLADSLDVYRAETELQKDRDHLINAQERLLATEDNLRDLLALPLNTPLVIGVPLEHTQTQILGEQAIQSALANRIEIDQARDQRCENVRLAEVAKENLWPEVNLVLNYSSCGRDEVFSRSCWGRRDNTWGLGFTTSSDFNMTREKMSYQQARLAILSAERSIEQAEANVILDVKRTLRNLDRSHAKIFLQEELIRTSTGELKLSLIKFERGLASNFDVIQAEQNLRSAELAHLNAVIDHIIGEYQFLAAMGLLCDKPN